MEYQIVETKTQKKLVSENLNYFFDKVSGMSAVWGKQIEDDPDFSPFGPFIADIEVTTKCAGPGGKLCPFCYKSNTPNGHFMSFDTFKKVFDKIPKTLQQIAFGVDAQCTSNPDIWKIMEYCRERGVIPNVTVADISDDTADRLASLCGAVAVSRYADKNYCYDSIKKLSDRGMNQVNMHIMISKETLSMAYETLNDILNKEERLSGLNAIVFLSLKKKGRGVGHTQLSDEEFSRLTHFCLDNGISFGFDSCSCIKFLKSIKNSEDEEKLTTVSEPCESTRFSLYVDTHGKMYPCSFYEGVDGWEDGISVSECNDFIEDVWNHKNTVEFRNKCVSCINNGVACQYYNI